MGMEGGSILGVVDVYPPAAKLLGVVPSFKSALAVYHECRFGVFVVCTHSKKCVNVKTVVRKMNARL